MIATGPWTLLEYVEPVSIVKLPAGSDLPDWADGLPLTSVTWTARETSVVCPTRCIPDSLPGRIEGPFTAFEVAGHLPFNINGVLQALTTPLAEAQVAVFILSTFETEWLLVPGQHARAARASWARAGHQIIERTSKQDAAATGLPVGTPHPRVEREGS